MTYIVAQLVGAYAGMLFSWLVLGHKDSLDLHPLTVNHSIGYVFLAEMLFSTLFQTVYLHAKIEKISPSPNFGLRAITMGIVQYANAGMIYYLTGGSLNATVGFSAITFRAMVRKAGEASYISFLPAYTFGPLVGAILAGAFTKFVAIPIAHMD